MTMAKGMSLASCAEFGGEGRHSTSRKRASGFVTCKRKRCSFASLHPGEMQEHFGWNESKESALKNRTLRDCSLLKKKKSVVGEEQVLRCRKGERRGQFPLWIGRKAKAVARMSEDGHWRDTGQWPSQQALPEAAGVAAEVPAAEKEQSLGRYFQEQQSCGWVCQQARWLLEVLLHDCGLMR